MPEDDATWRYRWPAGQRMESELARICAPAGRRVADLGCGQGALGLRALALGAERVLFADGSQDAIDRLAGICADEPRAACSCHEWGRPLPDGPYGLILGGDILYRPSAFPALIASIALSLAADGEALLGDPRATLEGELPGLAEAQGLTCASERRMAGYTLLRLRPR